MKKVVFENTWQDFFAQFGLKSFDDFFDYAAGQVIDRNTKRNVQILTFGNEPDCKVFFMKRFHNPHFKDILSTWCNFGKPVSQAEVEWQNARLLLSHNIDTYKPACLGWQTKWGLEKKSFFITEKLRAMEFTEFLSEKWPKLQQSQKEEIITAIAKLVRRTHDLDITLPDLSVWHFFIDYDRLDNRCRLSVIDLHRMGHKVKNENKKIKDLARFYWSMLPAYFDEELRILFIDAYMGNNWHGSRSAFAAAILKRANVLAKRQTPKDY